MDSRVSIHPALKSLYPDLCVVSMEVHELAGASADEVCPGSDEVRDQLNISDVTLETVASHELVAPWRSAVAAAGLKPSTYKASTEALARRYLKQAEPRTGIAAVDLYCAISTMHLAPMGAYDLDSFECHGELTLRFANPSDVFEPLGSGSFPLTNLVPVYAAGDLLMCWMFNHRDSAITALRKETSRAVFMSEALTPRQRAASLEAMADLGQRLTDAGASVVLPPAVTSSTA